MVCPCDGCPADTLVERNLDVLRRRADVRTQQQHLVTGFLREQIEADPIEIRQLRQAGADALHERLGREVPGFRFYFTQQIGTHAVYLSTAG